VTTAPAAPTTSAARTAFAVNSLLAGAGVLLVLVLSGLGQYELAVPKPHEYGVHPDGLAGAWSRMSDTVSYFTEWSNAVVAVSLWFLWRQPRNDSFWRRVLRLDSLIMITVTAIVYAVVLAPTQKVTGWSVLTNPWQHIAVPALTVLLFLLCGPRRWVSWRVCLAALVVPMLWVAWMLARGAVVDAYPYPFVNAAELGYGRVAVNILGILGFGIVLALLYWALDLLAGRLGSRRTSPPPE
jgi:hypothetical protein